MCIRDRFTRKPEDKRWIEVFKPACEALKLRCVLSEAMLVLMTDAMINLLKLNKV